MPSKNAGQLRQDARSVLNSKNAGHGKAVVHLSRLARLRGKASATTRKVRRK
jgi:hypothetical protein